MERRVCNACKTTFSRCCILMVNKTRVEILLWVLVEEEQKNVIYFQVCSFDGCKTSKLLTYFFQGTVIAVIYHEGRYNK